VSRWEELCRAWKKPQLQSKLLFLVFFHYIIIVFCFSRKTRQCGSILTLSFFSSYYSATHSTNRRCVISCFVVTWRGQWWCKNVSASLSFFSIM
jgi:hypothetical protein